MDVPIDIVSCIHEMFVELKASEKKVATLILSNLEFCANASISEIAQKAEVSEASVTRLAKKIGCKNVRHLKINIAKSLAIGQRFILEKHDISGINGIFESAKNTIQRNKNHISESLFKEVCLKLIKARQIIVIGMGGGSTIMSQELQFRLARLGMIINAYNDGLMTRMIGATLEKDDVLVVLSVTGYTKEVNEVAQIAKEYGSTVISITKPDTELSDISHYTLPIISEESDYIYKPSSSRYAMMIIIDILAYQIAMIKKSTSKNKLRRLKMTLDNHRKGGNRQPLGD